MDVHAVLPAEGTCGGILLLWSSDYFEVDQILINASAISVCIRLRDGRVTWTLTTVKGHSGDASKPEFIHVPVQIKGSVSDTLLVLEILT
jgi:hypothetical protein